MKRQLCMMAAALSLAVTVGTWVGGTPEQSALAQEAVPVGLGNYVFEPAELTVPAGTVTFAFANTDTRRHDMAILFNGAELMSDIFDGGTSGSWTVTLDQPGTYEYWCSVGNHRERGMVGTLTVQ